MSNDPTLFVGVTPVNPLALQDEEKEKTTPVTCGRGYETPLATFDPDTQYWKMCGDIPLWEEPPLLQSLPLSGMCRSGELFRQDPWEHLIDEIGYLLWPTPTAVTRPMEGNVRIFRAKIRAGEMTEEEANLILGKSVWEAQGKIPALWPTPVAKGGLDGGAHSRAALKKLENTSQEVPPSGKLNPRWLEWLMGFPIGWTELEDSETP